MKNVLLIMAPGHDAPNASAYALGRARELGGRLIVLAVLDPAAHSRVASALTNVGFVGERVREDMVEALEKDQRTFAEEQVKRVEEEARGQGVECESLVEEGDPSEICARLVRQRGVAVAVLVAEKRSLVTRFLSRSAPVRLPHLADCEVKVMED